MVISDKYRATQFRNWFHNILRKIVLLASTNIFFPLFVLWFHDWKSQWSKTETTRDSMDFPDLQDIDRGFYESYIDITYKNDIQYFFFSFSSKSNQISCCYCCWSEPMLERKKTILMWSINSILTGSELHIYVLKNST